MGMSTVRDRSVVDQLADLTQSLDEVVWAMEHPSYLQFVRYAWAFGDWAAEQEWPHLGEALCHLDKVEDSMTRAIDFIHSFESEIMQPGQRIWLLTELAGVLGLVRKRNYKLAAHEVYHMLLTLVNPPACLCMVNRLRRARQMTEQGRTANLGSLSVLPCDVLEHIAELVKQ